MYASTSSVNPTPLALADNQRDIHPMGVNHICAQRGARTHDPEFKKQLGMSLKALVDHIFVRLEPQVKDYVEVRNPQNTVQLLELLSKFEERYSCKAIRGSRNIDRVERRSWNEHRMSNVDDNRRSW
ncbi:uncharacterized protein TNCV_273391 [Trichonephila clavipes]|nr:uncharacterized protein TNCV_273391 [Trichonephila clavipes]